MSLRSFVPIRPGVSVFRQPNPPAVSPRHFSSSFFAFSRDGGRKALSSQRAGHQCVHRSSAPGPTCRTSRAFAVACAASHCCCLGISPLSGFRARCSSVQRLGSCNPVVAHLPPPDESHPRPSAHGLGRDFARNARPLWRLFSAPPALQRIEAAVAWRILIRRYPDPNPLPV